jgi:hypothetical protein
MTLEGYTVTRGRGAKGVGGMGVGVDVADVASECACGGSGEDGVLALL